MARPLVVVSVVLVVAAMLAGCQVAVAGRRCSGNGFARDSTYVLHCQRGRWARAGTIAAVANLFLAGHSKAAGPGAPASPGAPATPGAPAAPGGQVQPFGSLDVAAGGRYSIHLAGWAEDPGGSSPIDVNAWSMNEIGGPQFIVGATASLARPDVAASIGGPSTIGFDLSVPALAGTRYICVFAIHSPATTAESNQSIGCQNVTVTSDAPADPLPASAPWLDTVNYYRAGSGLSPVTDQPAWSAGIVAHLTYLANTPASYETGAYASAHTENPASPYYTAAGATEGGSSNLGGGATPRAAIDGWMGAPFHAIGILRPGLTQVAFGQLGGTAGLDVLSGLTSSGPPSQPEFFPGNGEVLSLRAPSGGEYPNPLESCPGYTSPGLPIIAMLPASVHGENVTAQLTLPDGQVVAPADLCVVDQDTYQTSDPVYGPTGEAILTQSNAVLIIPRHPLTPGTHQVALAAAGQGSWSWSFTESQ